MVDFQERDTRYDGTSGDAAEEDDEEGSSEGETIEGGSSEEETIEEGSSEGKPADERESGHGHGTEHAGAADHDHHAHDREELGVAVVTVSTSRSLEADPSGDAIEGAFEAADHEVVTRELVGDSLDVVQGTVDRLVGRNDVDVVVTTGGTGVSPDDVTVEAVRPLFEKDLPGFGEVFRRLSYEEVGTRVVGTRSVAGIADGVPIFALPGSENAVTLGTEEIILPEVGHLAGLATRGLDEDEE